MNRPPEPSESPSPDPVPAASLILAREDAGELQVYLLRRSLSTGFMAGYFVFPGGLVDAGDRDERLWPVHVDLTPKAFRERLGEGFGSGDPLAHAVAAIRETYEEAGVFLARAPAAGAGCFERLQDQRRNGNLGHGWMARQAATAGWVLRVSALSPWARWITPEAMPRRFDAPFFVAVVPQGQECSPDLKEATEGLWIHPRQALTQNLTGKMPLSPPTLVTLHELLRYPDLASLQGDLRSRRWGKPILPRLMTLGKTGSVIIEPWDPHYNSQGARRIDAEKLERSTLPMGEPFSRLWNRDGIWRPIGFT